jgi:hypothetical protein
METNLGIKKEDGIEKMDLRLNTKMDIKNGGLKELF